MNEPIIKVCCGAKGCNRVLATLGGDDEGAPGWQPLPPDRHPYWTDPERAAFVGPCSKHGGVSGTLDELNAKRATEGLPEVDVRRLKHALPWHTLRQAYERAVSVGVSHFVVSPLSRRL